MSSTNPEPGRDPVGALTHLPAGAPAHDDHNGAGPPTDAVIKRGYEEDRYDSTSVISVPILVVVFFVLAFSVVTVIFRYIHLGSDDPNANPMAVERNSKPLNERLEQIHLGGPVDQPRLEPLKLRSGDARAITRPELSVAEGNSPELHPEDLRPSPEHTPALFLSGWTNPNKTTARITIDEAMKLSSTQSATLFPTQKPGTALVGSTNIPTGSNAGRGPSPMLADKVEGKKEEHKH
jgi:hypothetical protein